MGYDEHEQVKPHLCYRVYSFSCRLSSDYATADQVSGMGGMDPCLHEIITFALPSSCFASLASLASLARHALHKWDAGTVPPKLLNRMLFTKGLLAAANCL